MASLASLAYNLLELVSYGKCGLSRPAKGKCLARKVRDRSVFIE